MNQFVDMLADYGFFLALPLVFLAIVVWVYRPSAKKRYEDDGNIPFNRQKQADRARNSGH